MRKTLLIAGIALLTIVQSTAAQTNLSWSSSFYPLWSDGTTNNTARNINGSSVSCRVNADITGGGSFQQAMGFSGAVTPTVFGSTLIVPESASALQVTPDYDNTGAYTTITLSFTSYVSNVRFKIADIDKETPNSTTYFDRVTVTASNGATSLNPVITKYDAVTDPDFLIINGNTASVNTANGFADNTRSDASDQRGTINVSFGATALTTITIRFDNAAGADANPAAQSIAVGDITFTNLTLPVRLSSFNGKRIGPDVALNWTVEQESNMTSYIIERNNGTIWEIVGQVNASSNAAGAAHYQFTDRAPQGTSLLYRLKMIDAGLNFKYSGIVRIGNNDAGIKLLTFPNPFISELNINVNAAVSQETVITLYDAGGKAIQANSWKLGAGNNNFTFSQLGGLTGGVYLVEVKDLSGAIISRSKIVKN